MPSQSRPVVIPREVREQLRIKPGQKLQLVTIGDQVRLVPDRPIREMRGILKGVPLDFDRDADEEDRGLCRPSVFSKSTRSSSVGAVRSWQLKLIASSSPPRTDTGPRSGRPTRTSMGRRT